VPTYINRRHILRLARANRTDATDRYAALGLMIIRSIVLAGLLLLVTITGLR
jgi:hypothetical protein